LPVANRRAIRGNDRGALPLGGVLGFGASLGVCHPESDNTRTRAVSAFLAALGSLGRSYGRRAVILVFPHAGYAEGYATRRTPRAGIKGMPCPRARRSRSAESARARGRSRRLRP